MEQRKNQYGRPNNNTTVSYSIKQCNNSDNVDINDQNNNSNDDRSCTSQQNSNNHLYSNTKDATPFVLPAPFP